ncbi:glycine betaine ABC transporter integral membrane protein [Streptomyces sp. e14]|nr:glycine betaine ABC transporter integral membrane protein [Streptomyces sp. e14]
MSVPASRTGAPRLLRSRALGKLLLLALVAAVLAPWAAARWPGATWPHALTVDLTKPLASAGDWVIDNRDSHPLFLYFFGYISNAVVLSVRAVYLTLLAAGWTGVTAFGALVAWRVAGVRLAAGTAAALLACGALGMWVPTMQTLALMVVAVLASVVLGTFLGLAAGLSDRLERALRPVLDTMQVLPAFAYLLPVVLVFGIGVPAAVLATVVYAAPPMARLTSLGLRSADPGVMEAVESLGATFRQRLLTARLPLARKEIMLGVNQTIMMALSMAVIASMIGAGGLGDRVYQALASVDVGAALAAGIPIVLLAVVLDRVTAAVGEQLGAGSEATPQRTAARWSALAVVTAAAVLIGRLTGTLTWPGGWVADIAAPVNTAKDWMVDHLYSGVPVVGGTADWAARFTTWVLDPIRDGLQWLPWWGLLLVVAAVAWLIGTWRTALTATLAMAAIGVLGGVETVPRHPLAGAGRGGRHPGDRPRRRRRRRPQRPVRTGPAPGARRLSDHAAVRVPDPGRALFGVGRPPAAAAAVIYALPAVIRIVSQGLGQVDPGALEAARSLGATGAQQLWQVQLPLARRALLLAVNQCVVLVLAVVVVGGLVGGGALGYDVVFGLAQGDLATGLVAGAAIVCLGLMLDRVTQPTERRAGKGA